MYMPVWGTLLILVLCTLVISTAGSKFIEIIISSYPDRKPFRSFFALLTLFFLVVLSVWLGHESIIFNQNYGTERQ